MRLIPGAQRVIHPAQRSRFGSLESDLWQTVEQVPPQPIEPIPLPEVCDSDMGEFDALDADEPAWRVVG